MPHSSERDFLGVSRSVRGLRWKSRLSAEDERTATAISQRHDLPDLVARALAARGVSVGAVDAYLSPSLRQDMPDPSIVRDMDLAAERLADAVAGGEQIAIFGDYDVDGGCASAILASVLGELGVETKVHIPDRIVDGYGPTVGALDTLIDAGFRLIVCVDCGSTSIEPLDHAKARGAEVIVVDHHPVGSDLPPAAAIVNPNRGDDLSELGQLSAAGVTFLVCVTLLREIRRRGMQGAGEPAPDLLTLLDLVALATVCDVVPMTGLNRAFVAKGLIALRSGRRPGIAALARSAQLSGRLNTGHLGFIIGPRLNAGGRIGDAALGVRLMLTHDPREATRIAGMLEALNRERQAMEADAVAEACADAEAALVALPDLPVLVVARPRWHPGIVGLVASRIKDRFDRPAIALALGSESAIGSGRSIAGVDLGAVVRRAVDQGILLKGGGHKMAAGMSVATNRLGDLRAFLVAALQGPVAAASADRSLSIDAALTAGGASLETIRWLEKAGPFGAGNPAPIFAFPAHRVSYADRAGEAHVRVGLSAGTGGTLSAIAFRAHDTELGRLLLNSRGMPVHMAGTLDINHWNGTERPQLRIVDAALPDRGN